MLRRLLVAYLALGYCSLVFSGESNALQEISNRLVSYSSLSGKFRQSKQLNFMDRPLVSSGSFTLGTTEGLSWLVQKPLRSEMRVKNSRVFLDGKKVHDRGVGQLMAMIMEAFMTADARGIQKDFSASASLLGAQWSVLLKPKSVILRSVLSHIELRGDEFLEEISIFELNETFTRIQFSEVVGAMVDGQDAPST